MSDTPETDAQSPWRYSITTPNGVTTHYVPADFARDLERDRNHWKAKFIQANKDYGFELRDPCGTIWDHAKRLQEENERLKSELATRHSSPATPS